MVVLVDIILVYGAVPCASIETGVVGALGIIVVGALFSLWFLSLSNVVAVVTRDQESSVIAAIPLLFPLLFISSAFLPLEFCRTGSRPSRRSTR